MSITKKDVGINCAYIFGLLLLSVVISFLGVAIMAKGFEGIPQVGYYIIPIVILVFVALMVIHIYTVWIIRPSYKKYSRLREFFIITSIIFMDVILALFVYEFLSPYAIPVAAASLIVAMLLSQRAGVVVGVFTTCIVAVIALVSDFALYGAFTIVEIGGILVGFICFLTSSTGRK